MKLIGLFVSVVALVAFTGCSHGNKHSGAKKCSQKKHHKMWKKMDKNSDGSLTKDEFDKAHAESFKAMDSNADGKVSQEEMKAFHKSKRKGGKKACCK